MKDNEMKDIEVKDIGTQEKLLKEIFNDFITKRNEYKIEIDNYQTEIEILKRKIEYYKNEEDESKIFSPRDFENNSIDPFEKLEREKEELEVLLDEANEQFTYYSDYCSRIRPIFLEDDDSSKIENDDIIDSDNLTNEHIKEDIVYNLNLNYDNNELENKLSGIVKKLELCLKIFDNDQERAKRDIKSVLSSLKKILKSMQ